MKNGFRLLFLISSVGLFTFYINSTFSGYNSTPAKTNQKPAIIDEYAIDTPGCKILKLDPFHFSVLSEIEDYSKKALFCNKVRFVVAHKRELRVNEAVPGWKNATCNYTVIYRKSENENQFGKTQVINITSGNDVNDEFVTVECFENSVRHYQDFFPFIIRKPDVEKRCKTALKKRHKSKHKQLSVLILGLDSVSKNSYIRHMHQVDEFIRTNLTYIELHGYNKIGFNTYPNMLPFNTGKLEREYTFDHKTTDLNKLPMIWTKFAQKGYRTLHAEDRPEVSTFNYQKKGFDKQPTDYYMRPFALAYDPSDMRKKYNSWGCWYDKPEAEVIFNWISDFFDQFSPDPLFAYVFLTRLTHGHYNTPVLYDKSVSQFLQYMHKAGHLDRTIVFFLSDHGFRFGTVGTTYGGHMEDKLPYFFFLLPSWFPQVYPKYYKNLKINERRLTTPLDMHATLLDIVHGLGEVRKVNFSTKSSVSLFKAVSENRTCVVAKILSHYCSCFHRHEVAVTDKYVKACAKLLVDYINLQTNQVRNICVVVELEMILHAFAQDVVINAKNRHSFTNFLVVFSVNPSKGIFQGIVLYDNKKKNYTVEESVNRMNLYGDQSSCVHDSHLKQFCYCN